MSRNLIIAIVASVLVVGGGALYFATQSDSSDDASTNTSANTQEQTEDSDATAFNPSNTLQQDFKATISTEGETSTTADAEYDYDTKTWRYVATFDGETIEYIFTEDAYYSQVDGQWIKLPGSGAAGSGFEPEAYEVTPEEISQFQSVLTYKGEASCPAGTCDLWEAENYQGNDKLSFYVEKQNNTINQMVSVSNGNTVTLTYTYEDVTIEVPTDAQEIPTGLGQ